MLRGIDLSPEELDKCTKDFDKLRPEAFDSITWTAHVHLSGLRFHSLEPKPVSTDGEQQASWAPLAGYKSKALRISVNLDFPTRLAIDSGSGTLHATSHISLGSVNVILYAVLIFLLFKYRKDFMPAGSVDHEKQKIRSGVRAARWISALGLLAEICSAALYCWYGKDTGFDGRGMPPEYLQRLGLVNIGMVGMVGMVILFFSFRKRHASVERTLKPVPVFGSLLVLLVPYGVAVMIFPGLFNLNLDFSPMAGSAGLVKGNIYAGGGQLLLMTSLTCAVLFVAMTVLHFTFSSIRTSVVSGVTTGYRLPLWPFLAASLAVSLLLMWQWVSQQEEFWDRSHVFAAFGGVRDNERIADVIGRMVTYYVDLFAELTTDLILWAAMSAIIYTLFWLGRGTASLRPSPGEYRLLGLLFAAAVSAVTAGSSYAGFTVPIAFIVAFSVVGYVLPRALRFNLLEKIFKEIRVGHGDPDDREKREREVLGILDEPNGLRGKLIAQQIDMDRLRDQARGLDAKLKSGDMTFGAHTLEQGKIDKLLAKVPFPPASVFFTEGQGGRLPRGVRPADAALAIGPGKSWWENGVHAAKTGAFLGALAVAYFSYIKIRDVRNFWFDSYLGLLRLLGSIIWEFGFWVIAAFVLGCLWRTLPGRRGPIKGAVLWVGFAVPFVIDFFLGGVLLHRDPVDGAWSHFLLLLAELLVVGFRLDWHTLRDAGTFRVDKWPSLVALYGLRGFVPTLSTLLLVVLPLALTAVDIYSQFGSESSFHDISQTPAPPRSK